MSVASADRVSMVCQTAGLVVSFIHSNKQKDRPEAAFSESHGKGDLRGVECRLVLASIRHEAKTEESQDHHCPSGGLGDGLCDSE